MNIYMYVYVCICIQALKYDALEYASPNRGCLVKRIQGTERWTCITEIGGLKITRGLRFLREAIKILQKVKIRTVT